MTPETILRCALVGTGAVAHLHARAVAAHPRAELVAIPNCGHYPMQECPPFFATLVERFLRRHAD